MDLVLEMCNTNAIHWCGVSGRQLGKLSPNSSLHLALKLLASVQGLQVSAITVQRIKGEGKIILLSSLENCAWYFEH